MYCLGALWMNSGVMVVAPADTNSLLGLPPQIIRDGLSSSHGQTVLIEPIVLDVTGWDTVTGVHG